MAWLLLALTAFCIGQIIFVLEMKSDHPDWQIAPCGLMSIAWPYLTARRYFIFCRVYLRG